MNLIWTNLALSEYEEAISYLLTDWSVSDAQKFIVTLNSTLDRIIDHPNMFKNSESFPYLRKAKVTVQKSIIYQVDGEDIVILRLIDNRSDHNY